MTMSSRRNLLAHALVGGTACCALPGVVLAAGDCPPRGRVEAVGAALLDRYVAAVNAHDTSGFGEIHAEAYVQHSGRSPNGLGAQVESFRALFARMPDVELRVEDRIISGDKVVARNVYAATHTQPLQGIAPTGKRFTLRTIDIWRVEDGKFAEHWDIVDTAGLQSQLRGQ
jgi:predicted ester cyclase